MQANLQYYVVPAGCWANTSATIFEEDFMEFYAYDDPIGQLDLSEKKKTKKQLTQKEKRQRKKQRKADARAERKSHKARRENHIISSDSRCRRERKKEAERKRKFPKAYAKTEAKSLIEELKIIVDKYTHVEKRAQETEKNPQHLKTEEDWNDWTIGPVSYMHYWIKLMDAMALVANWAPHWEVSSTKDCDSSQTVSFMEQSKVENMSPLARRHQRKKEARKA